MTDPNQIMAQQTTASLSSLPDELLIKITNAIISGSDKMQGWHATLAALIRTSHRFFSVTQPVLYSSFFELDRKTLPLFVRTMLRNPSLGVHVKSFTSVARICQEKLDRESFTMQDYSIMHQHAQMLFRRRPLLGLPVLRHHTALDYWAATIAVLLQMLPNLTDVKFKKLPTYQKGNNYYVQNTVQDAVMTSQDAQLQDSSMESPYSLLNFGEFFPGVVTVDNDLRIEDVMSHFMLSSITSLEVCRMGQSWTDLIFIHNMQNLRPLAAPWALKSLIMKECDLGILPLCQLLSICPKLEVLELEQVPKRVSSFNFVTMQPKQVRHIISHLKSSLKSISLFYDVRRFGHHIEEEQPIETLADFQKLTKIRTEAFMLMGAESKQPYFGKYDTAMVHRYSSTLGNFAATTQRLIDVLPPTIVELR